jgi:hypothetical protein
MKTDKFWHLQKGETITIKHDRYDIQNKNVSYQGMEFRVGYKTPWIIGFYENEGTRKTGYFKPSDFK